MLRCIGAVCLLVHALAESDASCTASDPSSCPAEGAAKSAENRGLTLLQGRQRSSKIAAESEKPCSDEGEDPFWPPGKSGCCPGLTQCGPYNFRWGWSWRCMAQCGTPLDECGCRVGEEGWSTTIQACRPQSTTSEAEAKKCEEGGSSGGGTTATTTATTTTASTTGGGGGGDGEDDGETPTQLKIMSWNVYFGNHKIDAMGNMLKEYDVDIANLQETNNRLERIAEEGGYISANEWKQPHDWCGYNFHKKNWKHEWSAEVKVPGSRGVCGAMIKKGKAKFCVWGLHPIQQGNNVRFAKESMDKAAEKMKECSEKFNAPSIFLGDFNTADYHGAKGHLEYVTGWQWSVAARHDIDFIMIQESPLKVGQATYTRIVGDGTCWPAFPPHNRVTAACGWADHSPLYAEIQLAITE
mmetsp:Transcript_55339/g.103821  ORF Transcript_55339/g.103821 Transcript_55339/m.103821 type:complete len:412 (-) Transcript_55339:88-1323(-)